MQRRAFALPLLTLATVTAVAAQGCIVHCEAVATAGPSDDTLAPRALEEADVVQLDEAAQRLYALSRGGSLAVVDVSQRGKLALLGKVALDGVPFEMVRRGDVLLTLANHAVGAEGRIGAEGRYAGSERYVPNLEATTSAVLSAYDVRDPANVAPLRSVVVPGEVSDTRVVGEALYVTSWRSADCYGCGATAATWVTSFDVSDPREPKQVAQLEFATRGGYDGWTPWKRSVLSTDTRLYVGGMQAGAILADGSEGEGVVEVVDIASPKGFLGRLGSIATAGPITSRWQLDESGGTLRVVSQFGSGRLVRGARAPEVEVFQLDGKTSTRVGHLTMTLPRMEALKTVRFDGPRAYAITFEQTDPLFTIDLSDPKAPAQKGQLELPGWIYHLEPRGEALIGLGLDGTDKTGNLNVTVFDVKDLAAPRLAQRVSFGPTSGWAEAATTEDQDRIQKAFRVYDDGLIAVPFSDPGVDVCSGRGAGIQLLSWSKDALLKGALLPMTGRPRRAVRRSGDELLGVSDTTAASFSIARRDVAAKTAEVTIGACVPDRYRGLGRHLDSCD